MILRLSFLFLLSFLTVTIDGASAQSILLKNATIIDGTGTSAKTNSDILISNGTISAVGKNLSSKNAKVIDLTGKTVIPALTSAHVHVGTLKGTTSTAENYTRENITNQLVKYQNYGITNVLSLGTDRPLIFNGFADSTIAGLIPGARLYSAGYGFNIPEASPASWMNMLLRPNTKEEVPALMDSVAKVRPTVLKMWVDDHGGKAKKMDKDIYKTIIAEAHKRNIRVAAHLFNVADANDLIEAGLDIIAHSIRDAVVDDALVAKMKSKKVIYIPTLSLDEYAYIYESNPSWIDDPFFKASLEPGVYEMLTSEAYHNSVKNSPDFERNKMAFKNALLNLKKIHAAGIIVALGTDSGAFAVRTQGFTEHHEMELMAKAGISPIDIIKISTSNAATALKINELYGTIAVGKRADLLVLNQNPATDIQNTKTIFSVWKNGIEVSKGPTAH